MCGVAGLIAGSNRDPEALTRLAETMTRRLAHRGPDGEGIWIDASHGVALGHRRLAVIDLSEGGAQPMASADGRCMVSFNGEIYNFQEIRARLEAEGRRFRSDSDTEVLVEAIAAWGLERALAACDGMFAFAAWMRDEGRLYLARDRIGKKPLYYGWAGADFVFGSELKALTAHPDFDPAIDREAAAAYFRFSYVPAPLSIYREARKLPPGCLAAVDMATRSVQVRRWHDWSTVFAEAAEAPTLSAPEAEARLDHLIYEATARRLVADVPVAAFLSGGIDSSLIAAQMKAVRAASGGARPVAFTIGFGAKNDETPHAKAVAAELGLDHRVRLVSGEEALACVPSLATVYDEPFADISQIPSLIVCREARTAATVALSGDGGDELFLGYDRYAKTLRQWRSLSRIPTGLRRIAAQAAAPFGLAGRRAVAQWGAADPMALYAARISRIDGATGLVPGAAAFESIYDAPNAPPGGAPEAQMAFLDILQWLPDDILVKMDRASMAVGLEVRSPLLDTEVIRFAAGLPLRLKATEGEAKILLRSVLSRHLPRAMFDRPKQGFAPPSQDWLLGPLRNWAETLLSPARLREDGLLNPRRAGAIWRAYKAGAKRQRPAVWSLLMFQSWREQVGRVE